MINNFLKYLLAFVIYLLVLQVVIINNLNLGYYIHPYVYILFLLILPIEIQGWLLLLLCFVSGLSIDVSLNTPGIHASACVFLGFIRPFILKSVAPRVGYDQGTLPIPADLGCAWFFRYTVICTVLHHFFLFFVDAFTFSHFWEIILRIILSSIFTIIFIFIIRLFSISKKRRNN
jgi:rod shape-determining protein MreD